MTLSVACITCRLINQFYFVPGTYARCVTKMYTEHPIGSTTAESANGTETAGGPSPTDQDQHRSVAPIPPNISFTAMQLPVRVDAPPMQERQVLFYSGLCVLYNI